MEVCHPLRIWARNKDVAVRFLLSGDAQPPWDSKFASRDTSVTDMRFKRQCTPQLSLLSEAKLNHHGRHIPPAAFIFRGAVSGSIVKSQAETCSGRRTAKACKLFTIEAQPMMAGCAIEVLRPCTEYRVHQELCMSPRWNSLIRGLQYATPSNRTSE